mmetsp:Transcript_27959/g.24630  ORF Transcript_27959/g.24630 Transcript_27959/m.24630 type:complete len:118 (-) Transcript_27959:1977-2330(-)
MNFYKECYKFMGETVMKNFITKLKKTQIEELEKFWEDGPKTLSKPLKGAVAPAGSATKNGADGGGSNNQEMVDEGQPEEIDPYDIADPVEVFSKFDEKWVKKFGKQEKWTEKRDMLK